MNNYFEWLNSDANCGYFLLTCFLLGLILFVIFGTAIFVSETIKKNNKVEEIENELKNIREENNNGI